MRKIGPEIKARRSQVRSFGHAWGSRLAEIVIAEGVPLSADEIERRLEQEIATRKKALREIGADADDVQAWVGAFSNSFARACAATSIAGNEAVFSNAENDYSSGAKVQYASEDRVHSIRSGRVVHRPRGSLVLRDKN